MYFVYIMEPFKIVVIVLLLSAIYLTIDGWRTSTLQAGGQPPQIYDSRYDRPPDPNAVVEYRAPPVPRVQWLNKPFKQAQRDPHFPIPPNLSPAQQLNLLVNKYGTPDIIYPKPGGLAVWTSDTLKNRGFCFERITISDYPSNYLNYRMYLPLKSTRGTANTQQLIDDLAVLHPVVSYDEIKQILELDANRDDDAMALFIPVLRLITGKLTYTEAQQLFQPILESVNPYATNYDRNAAAHFETEICSTQKSILVNMV